jgi:hypothetical protein|uniref:Uncharacterized protein n=1 Tax=Fagus sylvatica TaxID=28930 RepID=A0A2N9FGL5_FAGSY
MFSIDGLGSLLILETDLGLPAWWNGGSRRGGMGNGLGFSIDFRNGLGGVVVDGVVVGNGLGLADLGLGLPISAWACRSPPGFVDLNLCLSISAWAC